MSRARRGEAGKSPVILVVLPCFVLLVAISAHIKLLWCQQPLLSNRPSKSSAPADSSLFHNKAGTSPLPTMSRALKLSLCTTLLLVLLVVHLPGVLPSPVDHDSSDRYFRQHERSRYDHVQAGIQPGKRGAAASESAICSRHGTDIILKGGNAADAVRFLFFLQLIN